MYVRKIAYRDSHLMASLTQIHPHGRWRHLDAGMDRVQPLIEKWASHPTNAPDTKEEARRLVDLVVVSVLLDAGAGNIWKYTEEQSGQTFTRSEGLAVASVHMFQSGLFSSDSKQPYRVDGTLHSEIFIICDSDTITKPRDSRILLRKRQLNPCK
jgi:hypothetical protein